MTLKKLKGKNVIEVLNTVKDEYDEVKVGCVDGSSFFYIGDTSEASEYGWCAEYEEILALKCKTTVSKAEKMVKTKTERLPTPRDYVMRSSSKPFNVSLQGYMNVLEDGFKTIMKSYARLMEAKEYKDKRLPLAERTVADIYESIENPKTVIILVEGSEYGDYWTREEFERGVEDGDDTDESDA